MSETMNRVRVCGFLRENNLVTASRNGVGTIRGNVVIGVEETGYAPTDVRVDFYASAGTKLYDGLAKMLPTVAFSYTAIKNQYPMMTDAEAKAKATHVDAFGSLEENAFVGRDGALVCTTRVKGLGLFAKEGDLTPYESITATAYVETIKEEVDKEGSPTGRLTLGLCIPNCFTKRDGTSVKDAHKVTMVCQDQVAEYLSTYCPAGSTLPLIARFISRTADVTSVNTAAPVVGVNNNLAPAVSVIREIEIIGVSVNPMDYTETNGMDPAVVREMLSTRAARLEAVEHRNDTPVAPVSGGLPGRAGIPSLSPNAFNAPASAPAPAVPNFADKLNDVVF